jgi:hypothetical protein
VLHIEKDENKNQIHYALAVDAQCRLIGKEPVSAYWRDLELGPDATSALQLFEQPAYGVGEQEVVTPHRVRFSIRALPGRLIEAQVRPTKDGCEARALAKLSGHPAALERIFLELGALGLKRAFADGRRLDDGKPIREELRR